MPIREFVCTKCGHCFTRLFKSFAEDEKAKHGTGDACPRCNYIAIRVISAPARPILKGAGFYQNDYPKESR